MDVLFTTSTLLTHIRQKRVSIDASRSSCVNTWL